MNPYSALNNIRPDDRTNPFNAWAPRPADEGDTWRGLRCPWASRLAENNLRIGAALDHAKRQRWAAEQMPHPAKVYVGPSMAASTGIPQTTP